MGAQWLSGRVLDSRPRAAGSSLTGVTALWSLRKTHPSLVLVQPRKTRPYITEILFMGRNDSNKTNKNSAFTRYYSKLFHQILAGETTVIVAGSYLYPFLSLCMLFAC